MADDTVLTKTSTDSSISQMFYSRPPFDFKK